MASIVFAFFQIFENLNISKIIYQLSEKCFSYFWNFCENLLLKIWKTGIHWKMGVFPIFQKLEKV